MECSAFRAAGAALLWVPAAVLGQAASSPSEPPSVVISVTSVAQPSFDLPASVDVVTGAQLRDGQRQVNLSESLSRVPGLHIADRQNFAQDLQISSRGSGARSTFGIRGIRLYADGIPATMPDGQGQVSHFALSSAARVEVLRGPFSALHGNASGGVISIFTEDGQPGLRGSASFSAGSYGSWRAGIVASGAQGAISYQLEASRFGTEGYRQHSAAQRELENAKLKFRLGDATTLTWTINRVDMPDSQDPLGLTRAEVRANPAQATFTALQFNTRKSLLQTQTGAVLEHAFSATAQVRVAAYLGDRSVRQFQAIPTGTQAPASSPGGVIDLGRDYGGLDARYIRRGFINDGAYTLTLGASRDVLDEARRGYQNFVGTSLGVLGALRRDEDNRAVATDQFAQAEWQFAPAWRASAGVRRSRVSLNSRDRYIVAGNGDDSGAVTYQATTPVAGLVYSVNSQINLYATFGRGFETPTFNEIAYRAGGATGLNFALRPATSRQAEVGIKSNLGGVLINAALFRTRTADEIVTLTNAGGRATFQNAGSTSRDGVEISVSSRLPAGFSIAAAYTAVDARYRDSFLTCVAAPCAAPTVLVASGNQMPGVPRESLYAEVAWRLPSAGFSTALEGRRVARVYVDDRNTDSAETYTVFNLRAGFEQRAGAWTVSEFLRIDNLGDQRYVGSVIVNESNARFFEPSPGRNWLIGASASYRFK